MCTTELKKSVGCPRETRIIHDLLSRITFQRYYSITTNLYNKLYQSKSTKVLHNISLQTLCSKLTNLKFSYYNHSSRVALVTLLQITKTWRFAQEPNILLVVAYCKDGHAARSETHLLMRRTCNRGSTNPKYKSTPQDLTDKKGWR
jgi:hypothetical protein